MFIFGKSFEQVAEIRASMASGRRDYVGTRLKRVFDTINSGFFGGSTEDFTQLIDNLIHG
jgi:hypothetical protein